MTVPGRRRAPFAVVTAAMVLAVLALGTLPHPTRVERASATVADPEPAAAVPRRVAGRAAPEPEPPETVVPGLHAVGREGVRPGRYATSSDLCSWERRGAAGEVLASDTGSGQVLVEVRATDGAFSSAPGCGTWRALDDDDPPAPLPSFGAGTFAVGSQVAPGRWRSDSGDLCYWERLSGLGGDPDELLDSAAVPGPAEVVVAATDTAFRSFGCGTWRPAA